MAAEDRDAQLDLGGQGGSRRGQLRGGKPGGKTRVAPEPGQPAKWWAVGYGPGVSLSPP